MSLDLSQITVSYIIAGILFGAIGLYFLKVGKSEGRMGVVLVGLALMIYPYFLTNGWLVWGIGIALTFYGRHALRS